MKDSQKQNLRKLQKILRNSGIEKSIEETTCIRGYHDFSTGYVVDTYLEDKNFYADIRIEIEICHSKTNNFRKHAINHIAKLLKANKIKFNIEKDNYIWGIKL